MSDILGWTYGAGVIMSLVAAANVALYMRRFANAEARLRDVRALRWGGEDWAMAVTFGFLLSFAWPVVVLAGVLYGVGQIQRVLPVKEEQALAKLEADKRLTEAERVLAEYDRRNQ